MDRRQFLVATAPLLLARPVLAWAAREPIAVVSADLEAHVVEVGLARGRVLRRLRTAEGPRSVQACTGGTVLVGHASEGVVSVLEGRPLRVRRVLRGFSQPRYAACARGARHAFVTDSGHGEVAVVDLERARVVRRVGVGDGARHLTLDPAGRRLWIALGSSASRIVVVDVADPLRPRVVRRVAPPFLVHDVAFSPSGRRVWVTAGRVERLAVYAAGGRAPLRLLGADAAPQHVAFGAGLAYVASGEGRSVRVHALSDGRLLRTARVPYGSYNVQPRAGRVLTPSLSAGTLTILDRAGRVVREVEVARNAHDADAVA
jgi:DNA-binding beta-propeller fold protein YncE